MWVQSASLREAGSASAGSADFFDIQVECKTGDSGQGVKVGNRGRKGDKPR